MTLLAGLEVFEDPGGRFLLVQVACGGLEEDLIAVIFVGAAFVEDVAKAAAVAEFLDLPEDVPRDVGDLEEAPEGVGDVDDTR